MAGVALHRRVAHVWVVVHVLVVHVLVAHVLVAVLWRRVVLAEVGVTLVEGRAAHIHALGSVGIRMEAEFLAVSLPCSIVAVVGHRSILASFFTTSTQLDSASGGRNVDALRGSWRLPVSGDHSASVLRGPLTLALEKFGVGLMAEGDFLALVDDNNSFGER